MRQRELFTKAFNRVTFGAIVSIIANPLKMGHSVVSSHSDTSVRPTPIDAESSVSRQKAHNRYLMTYDWTDRLHRQTSRQEIDFGQAEGVHATGASPLQILVYGIASQIKPALVGLSVYRWEINVRAATMLGFVGAGWIGAPLFEAIGFFAWRIVSAILIAIPAVVWISAGISAYARTKVR